MRQTESSVQVEFTPPTQTADASLPWWQTGPRVLFVRWLNRGLANDRRIELRVVWPLWLVPLMFVNQLLAPHIVWIVFLIALSGFYLVGYLWVRTQAPALKLARRRVGSLLVAGDMLQEEFELRNECPLPLLWAEFIDASNVPGYSVGRIVACESESTYRWRTESRCERRGVFRLGPHVLRTHDPMGLFRVVVEDGQSDVVVIYPRVVHLPPIELPHGNAQGGDRQRRPIRGSLPAATISDYQRGDSLRHVHWISTARRGKMMVKDLEIEPSGNIWLVLDLDHRLQRGEGSHSTLEQGVVIAASLAAELLSGREQRAVGLLAFAGGNDERDGGLVEVLPAAGSAQTWHIMSELAPVEAGDLALGELLASSRVRIGRGSTVTVITPVATEYGERDDLGSGSDLYDSPTWVAELVHLRGIGVASSVVLVAASDDDARQGEAMRALLARMDIASTMVVAGTPLPALLTFRRRRLVVRSTPTGGVVSYEVDEEVG